jgi:hypothetical protein
MPGIVSAFQQVSALRADHEELRIPDSLYDGIRGADFCREALSMEIQRLVVRRLGAVSWSDLGDCDRAVQTLSPHGLGSDWARAWLACS